MKSIKLLMAMVLLLSTLVSYADIKNLKTENATVGGACSGCKQGIEAAAFQKNLSEASWNPETKIAAISYDTKKTSLDAVLKKIALAGYDNQNYLAPDDAYAKLDESERYERSVKTTVVTQEKMNDHQHAHVASHSKSNDQAMPAADDPLKPVLDAYYAVKDALVASDGSVAAGKAGNLVKALKAVKMDQLGSEQHTVWMKVMKDLDFDAEHIAETKDVGHQRDHFSSLSENMYKLIKSAKPSEPVYYQHCPMAKDGKGANWLSQVSAIKNPYYGAQMLNCGKTTETIK